MWNLVLAMAIGVVGTSVIHLSKGVMKRGIERLRRRDRGSSRRDRAIYGLGIAMNFTNPLWVIIANRFAPTAYYTSMYGLGLIALLVYSRWRLGEELSVRQQVGILTIVLGTLVIGTLELSGDVASLYSASRRVLLMISVLWLVAAPLSAVMARRVTRMLREVVFGVAAGGAAALEAVVKGVAQAGPEVNTVLPQSAETWVLFVASFAGAALAFGMIQWSFLRSCRASMMGAIYTTTYVAVPLILTPLLTSSGAPSVGSIVGILLLAGGAALAVSPHTTRSAKTYQGDMHSA